MDCAKLLLQEIIFGKYFVHVIEFITTQKQLICYLLLINS